VWGGVRLGFIQIALPSLPLIFQSNGPHSLMVQAFLLQFFGSITLILGPPSVYHFFPRYPSDYHEVLPPISPFRVPPCKLVESSPLVSSLSGGCTKYKALNRGGLVSPPRFAFPPHLPSFRKWRLFPFFPLPRLHSRRLVLLIPQLCEPLLLDGLTFFSLVA